MSLRKPSDFLAISGHQRPEAGRRRGDVERPIGGTALRYQNLLPSAPRNSLISMGRG